MFGFTQITGGKYFAEPTESDTARQLKSAVAVALDRRGRKQELITPKDWFAARLGENAIDKSA